MSSDWYHFDYVGGLRCVGLMLREGEIETLSETRWENTLKIAEILKIAFSNVNKFTIRRICLSLLQPYENLKRLDFLINKFKHEQIILFTKSIKLRSALESIELFNISCVEDSERGFVYMLRGIPSSVTRFVHDRFDYLSNLSNVQEKLPYSSFAAFMIKKFLIENPQLRDCEFRERLSLKNRNVILSGWIHHERAEKLKELGGLEKPSATNVIDFNEFR